jgi:hypothetical protein
MHAAEVQWREIFVAAQHIQRHMLTNELRFRVNVYELVCVYSHACVCRPWRWRSATRAQYGGVCRCVVCRNKHTDPI